MSDPAAAARSRRYRARRRAERAGGATIAELLDALIEEVHNLRDTVDNFAERGVTFPRRDATPHHARLNGAGAGAGAESDAGTHPSGASTGVPVMRDAITALRVATLHGRILEQLARSSATVPALADAIDLGQRPTLEALIELSGLGLVERAGDRWARRDSPLVESLELGLEVAYQ